MQQCTYEQAFQTRDELKQYGKNARLLFSLELRFRLEDIVSLAAECLTDGPDDMGCDLVYIDRDDGYAVIAQGYEPEKLGKKSAPANKVRGLMEAVSWLLSSPVSQLPERLRPAAEELRSAIEAGSISSVHIWYVHGLPESENVGKSLRQLEMMTNSVLETQYRDCGVEEVLAKEVGRETLEEWYRASTIPILVSEPLQIVVPGGYETKTEGWKAYTTAVPARWLYEMYRTYGSHLFSANIRNYLGSRRSDRNINYRIKETAKTDPTDFWVFNNGITALTNDYDTESRHDKVVLKIHGLSIVNGAQTTGAIGSLQEPPDVTALVPARFVKCTNLETLQLIILYNNSQNKIEATDFRSNDPVQQRLRKEFEKIPNATYLGGRRGSAKDKISRPPYLIPSDTAAQALAAFHQDPVTAYNEKANIWANDKLYSTYFNERTYAEHIVFTYSLLRCIEEYKMQLKEREHSGQPMTEEEQKQLSFLRNRGATLLMVAATAKCLETFCNRHISDVFRLSFGPRAPKTAIDFWMPIVQTALPLCTPLLNALQGGLKNREKASEAIQQFKSLVEAVKGPNSQVFQEFASRIKIREAS